MSPRLALSFLGVPELILDNTPVTTDRRKVVALLAYLSVNRGTYTREFLSGLLWPDYDQAKAFSNLRRTIWEVHQVLGEGWLIADRDSVQLNVESQIDLDIAQFQDLLARSQEQSDSTLRVPFLSDAAKLYRNHFLTGFSIKDAFPFNEWAYAESEELCRQLADALTTLSEDYCSLGQAEKAIPHARRLISLDPLNESTHRQLMSVYLQAGQPNAALKQYQTCEQLLRKELNLDPQPETRELYKKTRKREARAIEKKETVESFAPQHNLPAQLSTFIGREKECDEIVSLLTKHRLITLVGVGGIGKSRLSLQVGEKVLNHFPDGVWFVALDSLSDPRLVQQTVAAEFGIREGTEQPVIETLMDTLRKKTILLILDNCEHLLNACAELITTLLTNCQHLKILVTSREVLNVEGEAIFYLPSLSLPEEDNYSLEKMKPYESIQLFAGRAELALSSFRLTDKNIQSVAGICRKVDGIPLAIELAAAHVNILKAEEILKQLHYSFTLLARNGRTVTPRHQTMQASIDWSWGLLAESEQRFLQQLAIFAGGWTLESAQVVCDGDVLNFTSALVKKSLIMVDQKTDRETRYHFHEIVRQYAREKLVEAGEEEKIRDRHLKYFLQLSEHAEPALRGPAQIEWMTRLNDARDNIRAALAWANKTDTEVGLYISSRLGRYFENLDMREGNYWLSTFLHKPESQAYPRARAGALYSHLRILNHLNQVDKLRSTAKECLELYRALGDQSVEVDILLISAQEISSVAHKTELFQHALKLVQTSGDVWRHARLLHQMGWNHSGGERLAYWQQAIMIFRQLGDWRSLAQCLCPTGYFALLNGDLQLAQKCFNEAALLNDKLKDKEIKIELLSLHARIDMIQGDYNQAHLYLHEELGIADELGDRMRSLWCRSHLGYLFLREGNLSEARDIFTETAQNFQQDKNIIGVVFTLEGMSELHVAIGKPEHAAGLAGWADATRAKIYDTRPPVEQADVDKIITACLIKMGEEAFSDAYDEGQKMTLDEAVAFALTDS